MEIIKPNVLELEGEIYTSAEGIGKLMRFYEEASKYSDTTIVIDFYKMVWIDANLAAFLNAIVYRLQRDCKLQFTADFTFLSKNFPVLFTNGWLRHEDYKVEDVKTEETTIPCTHFLPTQEKEFVEYIDTKLMCHKGGMNNIDKNMRKRIKTDLVEIFQNIFRHARTEDPCFICGQFYPNQKYFILTLVDLGVGFLAPIEQFTGGEINTHIKAIRWALSGKSSLVKDPHEETGGLGLEGILDYCKKNRGIFQIFTGTDFWGTDLESTVWQGVREIKHGFRGSVLNLFFNFKE